MADAPPQLGEIPQRSELSVPTLQSNMSDNPANGSLQNTKDALYDSKVCNSQLLAVDSIRQADFIDRWQSLLLA